MSRIIPSRPHEEEQELRLAIMRLEKKDLLWRQYAIADADTPFASDMAPSTYFAIRAAGGGPSRFKIGRRYYVRTAALRSWLDEQPTVTTSDSDDIEAEVDGKGHAPDVRYLRAAALTKEDV